MSIAEMGLRQGRASLRSAVRRGDLIGTARAYERLRGHDAALTREERAAGRQARVTLGRAIRDARARRIQAAAFPFERSRPARVVPIRKRSLLRRWAAIGLAAASLVAVLLVALLPRGEEYAPAAAPPQTVVAAATPAPTPVPGGRGRASALLQPVALATSAPTPAPTEAPSAPPPSAAAGPSPTTGAPGGVAGGVTGGVPGGTVGGVPGGVIGGTGTKTATPAPTPTLNVLPQTPPPLAVGQDRFLFRVLDSNSRNPVNLTCVVFGTETCGANDPHTNTLGYYWLDVTPNSSVWNFRFFHDPDYFPAVLNRTATPGMGTVSITILLRHR